MSRENEAYMPRDMVLRVLEAAGSELILVGGQALAYWMDHYDIQDGFGTTPAVSRDVDFLTRDPTGHAPLRLFARAIGGRPEIPPVEAITALVGSAIAPAEPGRIYNVDLLHRLVGVDREKVFHNSAVVSLPGSGTLLRVMHPLDVLRSRNANLHELIEKQDDAGQKQLRLSIEVARRYLEDHISALSEHIVAGDVGSKQRVEREIFKSIKVVIDYARGDAARKNAERYGIHLADAVPVWRITSPTFWARQWTRLRDRMSPEYVAWCEVRRPD